MKTKFSLGLITLLLLVSCTNLDDVYRRLDDHDARIKKLETLTADANKTIASLQKLVDAQAQKISIVSYTALPKNEGYKLVMSDGSEIILKHGKDGKTPSVGIEEVDGVLYWTLDGELMRDAAANPIRVKGEDGKAGVTPQLRVNADGNWEVSLDGGVKWELVKDVNGKPVKAVGTDAASDLKITDNGDGTITIIFNGMTFVIPSVKPIPTPQPENRPSPLAYVAEYNLADLNGTFETEHDITGKHLFTWNDAVNYFRSPSDLDGNKYHLASKEEWNAIIPDNYQYVDFENNLKRELTETEVSIAKKKYKMTGTFISDNNNAYATLTYQTSNENPLFVVAKYNLQNEDKLFQIQMQTVSALPSLDDIANEEYWASTKDTVTRSFPMAGGKYNANRLIGQGVFGCYWCSSEHISDAGYYVNFGRFGSATHYSEKRYGYSIRLFSENP